MDMTRKRFLVGSLAVATVQAVRSETAPYRGGGTPKLRFGVVSDVHVGEVTGTYGTEDLVKAFSWFRDQGVDGVVIAGDMADTGRISQLQLVAEAWEKVFPGDKGQGGRHVEKLFIYGNHDIEGFQYNNAQKDKPENMIVTDRKAAWERVFKEPYAPIWKKTVKGYTFIGAHWDKWWGVPPLESYLSKHAAELRGERSFFYIQHPHPLDTCHGHWAWGHDNGIATRALSAFPNAIAFSGHSHHPLVDERSIWQGAFTSVGTGALRYVSPMNGRENSGPAVAAELRQMPPVDKFKGKEGLLVSVYGNRVVISRRDFVHDDALGPDWIVPLPVARAKPYDFVTRVARATAPQFPIDAKVTVSGPADGKDRLGRAAKQLTVTFPAALHDANHLRAYDYEVVAEVKECDFCRVASTKRVYSPTYFLAPKHEAPTVCCVFAVNELNARKAPFYEPSVRFIVRAAESFGKASAPIVSDWISLA